MKIKLNLLCFFFFVLGMQCVYADSNKEAVEIFRNTRCITCGGQSIEDSNSDFAKDLKNRIKKKIQEGHSKRAIYDELKEEYGEDIFFTSPASDKTFVILGAIIFIILVLFLVYLRR